MMIETTDQAIAALEEIKRLTKWTNRRLAFKCKLEGSTVHRILKGETQPNLSTMSIIDTELKRVKRIHGAG